jgi:hypothetical protein
MGWRLERHGSKHDVWIKEDREIAIPRHREINEYTARNILIIAGRKTSCDL